MISPDYPIKSKDEDKLKRAPIAENVATIISNFKGSESFVIGIEGPWGSGKTSLINLILENLGRKVVYFVFNPWNFSSEVRLMEDFFKSFSSVLKVEKKGSGDSQKQIYKQIEDYLKAIKPAIALDFQPEIALGPFKLSLGSIQKSVIGDRNLEKLKSDIDKSLKKLKKKIVVVIDDIDRLDPAETKLIFKLVKLTANFPNTIFLLAYDRIRVEERLTEKRTGFDGKEYLKKIVQVNFGLPKPDSSDMYDLLFSEMDKTLESPEVKSMTKKYWDEKRWGNLFHGGFKEFFVTIRDINRFVSSWRLNYLIVGYEEVNPIDFAGIELIRIFTPEVHNAIAENKELFTKGDAVYSGRSREDERKQLYNEVLEKAPEGLKESVDGVIQQLFPRIKGLFENISYPHTWEKEWKQKLKICSGNLFDVYFQLAIPTGGLSQGRFNILIKSASDSAKFETTITSFKNQRILKTFLDNLTDSFDNLSQAKLENIIAALFNVGDQFRDQHSGMSLETIETKIMRACYQSLKRITAKQRIKVLEKSIKSTNGLYAPMRLLGILIDEQKEYEGKAGGDKPVIEGSSAVKNLETLLVIKIRKVATKNPESLKSNKFLGPVLYLWVKREKGKKLINNFTSNLLKSLDGLKLLLGAFKTTSYSQGLGDYVSVRKEKIDLKWLSEVVSISKVEESLKKFITEVGKLPKKEKEIFNLYKEERERANNNKAKENLKKEK